MLFTRCHLRRVWSNVTLPVLYLIQVNEYLQHPRGYREQLLGESEIDELTVQGSKDREIDLIK